MSVFEIENEQLELTFALFVAIHPTTTLPKLVNETGFETLHDCDWIPNESMAAATTKVAVAERLAPSVGDTVKLFGHTIVGGNAASTSKVRSPFTILVVPIATDIENCWVTCKGKIENAKVKPPSLVISGEEVDVDDTEKSVKEAVVLATASETVIVQLIAAWTRAGLMFKQLNDEVEATGTPNTDKEIIPPEMGAPPTRADIKN